MSKNVAILEGDVAKRFNNVKKIQLHNTGGGTDYWVPESETKLVTKHINENGTYKAEDEEGHPYGYSQVTVSGIGKVIGYDENNDLVEIDRDENDKIRKKYAPVSIAFTQSPRLIYNDGDKIDLTGAQVRAYLKNGTPWEGDETHPHGYIPLRELTLNPTTASLEIEDEYNVEIPDVATLQFNTVRPDTPRTEWQEGVRPDNWIFCECYKKSGSEYYHYYSLSDPNATVQLFLGENQIGSENPVFTCRPTSGTFKSLQGNYGDETVIAYPFTLFTLSKLLLPSGGGAEQRKWIAWSGRGRVVIVIEGREETYPVTDGSGHFDGTGIQEISVEWKYATEKIETSFEIQVHIPVIEEEIHGGGGGHDF